MSYIAPVGEALTVAQRAEVRTLQGTARLVTMVDVYAAGATAVFNVAAPTLLRLDGFLPTAAPLYWPGSVNFSLCAESDAGLQNIGLMSRGNWHYMPYPGRYILRLAPLTDSPASLAGASISVTLFEGADVATVLACMVAPTPTKVVSSSPTSLAAPNVYTQIVPDIVGDMFLSNLDSTAGTRAFNVRRVKLSNTGANPCFIVIGRGNPAGSTVWPAMAIPGWGHKLVASGTVGVGTDSLDFELGCGDGVYGYSALGTTVFATWVLT